MVHCNVADFSVVNKAFSVFIACAHSRNGDLIECLFIANKRIVL